MGNPGRTSPVKIRDMSINDMPEVYTIGNNVFTKKDYVFLYRTWEAYEITGLYTTDPELCIVAERDNAVIGFAIGSIIEKPKSAWTYGYLIWVGVQKGLQGANVGKKLYQEMERRTRKLGARMMIIDTEGSNVGAIKFFSKMGFKMGSKHVWMTKNLVRSKKKSTPQRKSRAKILFR